jgi:tRNA(Ile)-lysidine synthase
MTMHRLEKKVLEFIRNKNLMSRGDKIVVAVSGGADSISLIQILHNVRTTLGVELHVAHLDHGLRGKASLEDADFVRTRAAELGLQATIESRDVKTYRKQNHLSLEEAAREVRYKFLEEVVIAVGGASVAVAHTSNDHVETLTLHLLRGTGLTGLVGLKEKSILQYKRVGPLPIIRPLLCISRADVEQYCRDLNLEFRTDSTNESLSITRNRIRHKLLPRLRAEFNPRIDEALDRLSRLASDDVNFINSEASKAVTSVVRAEGDKIRIERPGFLASHPALKRAVLRQALASVLGSPKDIEATHIEEMLALAAGEAGRSIDLPGGIKFSSGYQELMLGRNLPDDILFPVLEGEYKLNLPGVTDIPGWRIVASIDENESALSTDSGKGNFSQVFDFDLTGENISVRPRKSGDRFQPLGMDAEKSVKDFFIDAKVPRPWRSRVPIVVNPSQVVWVVGYRLDDRVKIIESSRRKLRLEFEMLTPNSPVLSPGL